MIIFKRKTKYAVLELLLFFCIAILFLALIFDGYLPFTDLFIQFLKNEIILFQKSA